MPQEVALIDVLVSLLFLGSGKKMGKFGHFISKPMTTVKAIY